MENKYLLICKLCKKIHHKKNDKGKYEIIENIEGIEDKDIVLCVDCLDKYEDQLAYKYFAELNSKNI